MNGPALPETHITDLPRLVLTYAMDPVTTVRRPTVFTWPASITLQVSAAFASVLLGAALERNWIDLIVGAIVLPILTLLVSSTLTIFLYYYFVVFQATYLEMRRLSSLVVLSTFPYFVLHAFAGLLPPLDLLGFLLTILLLVVGLSEQFGLARKIVVPLLGTLLLVFAFVWGVVQVVLS